MPLRGASVELRGDKELTRFFRTAARTLQRDAVEKAVKAGGEVLARQIRRNIGQMVGESSASRGGQSRHSRRGKKTSLKESVGLRPWSKKRKGLIGVVVGPKWPEGAHGHLVEFGHEVVSHGKRTGKRTRPRPFQRRAMVSARPQIVRAVRMKLKQVIGALRAK